MVYFMGVAFHILSLAASTAFTYYFCNDLHFSLNSSCVVCSFCDSVMGDYVHEHGLLFPFYKVATIAVYISHQCFKP